MCLSFQVTCLSQVWSESCNSSGIEGCTGIQLRLREASLGGSGAERAGQGQALVHEVAVTGSLCSPNPEALISRSAEL